MIKSNERSEHSYLGLVFFQEKVIFKFFAVWFVISV